jgi:hypothetical protein
VAAAEAPAVMTVQKALQEAAADIARSRPDIDATAS